MVEDAELLRRYAEDRSEAAFAELVQRHLGFVYAAALRQLGGATHRAEEVAQAVFIDLARKAAPLAERTEIVGWLYTSTHYAAAKLKRGEQRRQSREQEAHAMNEILSDNGTAADWDRLRPVLDDAMLELGEPDREVILMRFFQGRRFTDVGRKLGLSEDAARMRAERALEKLRTLLARREITSTTAALGLVLSSQPAVALPATLAASVTGAALAGGSVAGGVAVGATIFMQTKTLLAAAAAVLTLGVAVHQFNQRRVADLLQAATAADLAKAERERADLQARLQQAQTAVLAAEQQSATLQGELAAARAAPKTIGNTGQLTLGTGVTSVGVGKISFIPAPAGATPEDMKRQVRQANFESMDETYQAFYRQAGLTKAQIAQFRLMMSDFLDRRKDQMDLAMAQNPTLDRDGRQTLLSEIARRVEEEWMTSLRGMFGDAAMQALQHYREVLPARTITRELAGALFHTDIPLTTEQSDRLVEVIAANARGASNQLDLGVLNQEAVLAQAQAFLSPSQVRALRIAQQQALQRWTVPAIRGPNK